MFFSESESVDPNEEEEEEEEDKLFQWTNDSHDKETEEDQSPHCSWHIPNNPEFNNERRTDSVGFTKEVEQDVFQNIHEDPDQNVETSEEKPWKKSGADITDYFNYGFDEESWKAYCRRHAKLQAFQKNQIAKVMREQAKYEEVVSRAPITPNRRPKKSRRQRKAKSTRSRGKGKSGRSRREKARLCHADAAKDTQAVAKISHEDNRVADYDLPRSVNVRSTFSFLPPPSSLFQLYQSASPANTLSSDNLEDFKEPSTSLYPCVAGNMATGFAVIDTTKSWECFIKQKRDKDKSREEGRDKKRQRSREGRKWSSSSSHHSGKQQSKLRDSTEQLHKRSRAEVTCKKKQEDEEKASGKTSQSRSRDFSRKDDRRERKTRHDHTKGKDVGRPRKAAEKRN